MASRGARFRGASRERPDGRVRGLRAGGPAAAEPGSLAPAPVLSARPPPPKKRGLPVRPPPTVVRVTYAEAGPEHAYPEAFFGPDAEVPPSPDSSPSPSPDGGASAARPPPPPPPSASTKKKRKARRQLPYAPPGGGAYAHLGPVADCVAPDLDVLFCGYNPGVVSAERGHHFAGPTNAFWIALSQSGLTSERVTHTDDQRLPRDFKLGLTNLVPRATRSSSELCSAEMREEAVKIKDKILKLRPRVVCFVGDGVYKAFSGRPKEKWGRQPETVVLPSSVQPGSAVGSRRREAVLFVMPSTSGRTVGISREAKYRYFRQLKELRDGLLAEEAMASFG